MNIPGINPPYGGGGVGPQGGLNDQEQAMVKMVSLIYLRWDRERKFNFQSQPGEKENWELTRSLFGCH